MSALATVSMVDIYRRHFRKTASDHHYLNASRVTTLFWGCYAVLAAQFIKEQGSLVETVNLLGACSTAGCSGSSCWPSTSHGYTRAARSTACSPARRHFRLLPLHHIAFLWYNVIGCAVVIATGLLLQKPDTPQKPGQSQISPFSLTARLKWSSSPGGARSAHLPSQPGNMICAAAASVLVRNDTRYRGWCGYRLGYEALALSWSAEW